MNINNILSNKNKAKIFANTTFVIYLICLFYNLYLSLNLISEYRKNVPVPNVLLYHEVLQNNSIYDPPVSLVIIRSLYTLVFTSLIICIFSYFCKRYRRGTPYVICVDLAAVGIIVLFKLAFALSGISALQLVVILGITILLFSMAYLDYKRKPNAIVYAFTFALVLIENTVFTSVITLSIQDVVVYILFSIIGVNWKSLNNSKLTAQ